MNSKMNSLFCLISVICVCSLITTSDGLPQQNSHDDDLIKMRSQLEQLKNIKEKLMDEVKNLKNVNEKNLDELKKVVRERIKRQKQLRIIKWKRMESEIGLEYMKRERKRLTAPDPPFTEFKVALHNKTVVEWINMFPPYSRERLAVVTAMLNESVEKWALAGFVHGCINSYGDYTSECTFCNDRVPYIKCVMSGELTAPINPNGQTHLFIDNNALKNATHEIQDILCNSGHAATATDSLTDHFLNIEKAIEPFQVKRADGIECRICTDFHRKVYDPCFSQWQHFEH